MSKIFDAPCETECARTSQAPTTRLAEGPANGLDRRRSPRRAFVEVINVYGRRPSEEPFYEEVRTIDVSVHGALLLMPFPVEEGQEVLLVNDATHRQQVCRVVYACGWESQMVEVAVEFPTPHGEFWECPQAGDEKQPSPENRLFPRVLLPKGIPVAWKNSRERTLSRLDSISMGGVFIKVPDPPPVGEIIELYFGVPGGDVRARAIVRRSHKGKGMGIQFVSMAQDKRARLSQLLQKLLAPSPKK
jgi:hypothetical protein